MLSSVPDCLPTKVKKVIEEIVNVDEAVRTKDKGQVNKS
jgi:hypothetical protein